ncbi:hypothetical protein EJC49_01195 [Aquibium carbonis]|uniref:Clp protease n=1 Tax=Aquibium carbonis TaxID=2495581 RepID=A0A3S0AAH4_9HYPH|nr:hypothetical protein [Aquibium carbonis]RST88342.1 hypothetical protein EJC49_01195 [Aquibium carbonis]
MTSVEELKKDQTEVLPEPRRSGLLARYFARFDEGEVIRYAFGGLLIGTFGVLGFDMHDLIHARATDASRPSQHLAAPAVLPPAVDDRGSGSSSGTTDPRGNVTADEDVLRAPMQFTLEPGGVLTARGYIDMGARARFEAELAARGEYVRIVALDSPGGALDDALGMSRLIRDRGLSTLVEDGALCASSCPLVLAGGTDRSIGPKAAVGVHQFYSVSSEPAAPAQAMSDAQATTARISRHLSEMGVDPALWLHALDTPPRSLYYLSAQEIQGYKLSTGSLKVAARQ